MLSKNEYVRNRKISTNFKISTDFLKKVCDAFSYFACKSYCCFVSASYKASIHYDHVVLYLQMYCFNVSGENEIKAKRERSWVFVGEARNK